MTEFSDVMRRLALIEMAEMLADQIDYMHHALQHGAMHVADIHFETLAIIARDFRKTRKEMTDMQGGPGNVEK